MTGNIYSTCHVEAEARRLNSDIYQLLSCSDSHFQIEGLAPWKNHRFNPACRSLIIWIKSTSEIRRKINNTHLIWANPAAAGRASGLFKVQRPVWSRKKLKNPPSGKQARRVLFLENTAPAFSRSRRTEYYVTEVTTVPSGLGSHVDLRSCKEISKWREFVRTGWFNWKLIKKASKNGHHTSFVIIPFLSPGSDRFTSSFTFSGTRPSRHLFVPQPPALGRA